MDATSTASGKTPELSAAIDERRKKSFEYTKSFLLGKQIKTTLSDGRTLSGRFICIDRLKNLILTNVTEERWIDPSDYKYRVGGGGDDGDNDDGESTNEASNGGDGSVDGRIKVQRLISQAMIPGNRLVKAEINMAPYAVM